jgi:DNA-directed RNA polymerase specialized sigma24 family protein
MTDDGSITQWIGPLREGDSAASQEIWNRYYAQLVRLARKKLLDAPRTVADEEDVVICAFENFCRGVEEGRFPKLRDRHDLWQVLVMLTGRKAANQVKLQQRQKRGGAREAARLDDEPATLDQLVAAAPTPEFADQVAAQCREMLDHLQNRTLQEIAIMKLEGYKNDEIAERLGVLTRTVERKLRIIRRKWSANHSP